MTRQSQLMIAGIATGVLVLALLAAQFLGPNQAAPSAVTSPPASRPPDAATSSPIESPAPAVPAFRHVYLIIMENQEYSSIVGNAAAPYINSLIEGYGLAAEYHGVAHPSQPNYFALFSGSTQGVTDNDVHDLEGTHLADQLDAAGRTWSVFAENVPLGCFTGAKSSGGPDGSGEYVRKHEPAISFTNIATDPERCGRITNLSHLDAEAASFELIVPNLCNDMHDCSVAAGDGFLKSFVPRITGSPAFADSVLFITWDEGSSDEGGGGHVATLVVSPLVSAGTVSQVAHDHYSLLRTIQNAWDLGCLGETCSANDLREFFDR